MNTDVSTTPSLSPCYTLSEAVDEYLATRGVDKKKYYARYLIIAKRVWQRLFWNTLWITKSVWQPLKKGDPYNYIDVPRDKARILSISQQDPCGKVRPLYYNSQINVVPKPKIKKCGCGACDCGGLCEDVNSFTVTTKLLFTINGVNYYEKTWLKYCTNGDILEYREVPTKKYLDYKGDGASFNNDFNNDFDIGGGFGNYEITTEKFQQKICHLTTQPCGCPEETQENEQILMDFCGCFFGCFTRRHRDFCNHFLENPDPNCLGEVKLSECGTKIFYIPNRHRFRPECTTGTNIRPAIPTLPDFLQVNYQTNGQNFDEQVLVPDFSVKAVMTGIDSDSKMFNNKYSLAEKKDAEYRHNDEVNKLILFLNPLSLDVLSHIQDAPTKW
jgi:hypothetical protein